MVKKFLPYLIVFILAMLLLAGAIYVTSQPRGEPVVLLPAPTQGPLVIDVGGAVRQSGVYTLAPDSRVQEAIAAAGGLSENADTSSINLAAKLRDGQKIWVPAIVTQAAQPENTSPAPVNYPIDLNNATLEQLDSLPGIGPTYAQNIINYRESHGGFQSIDEVKQVEGIGDTRFAQIKDLIFVDAP